MKLNKTLSIAPLAIIILSGCASNIGKSEFACPNGTTSSEGVCAGPRMVYELTNDRADLSDLSNDPEYAHLRPTGSNTSSNPRRANHTQEANSYVADTPRKGLRKAVSDSDEVTVFKARDNAQQSHENFQRVEPIPQQRFERHQNDAFQGWPNHDEALAPEPLAVMETPEVMRVLVAAWPDNAGNLNMPGYVYVEVTERRFNVGSAANTRPSRVVPFEMRQQSQEEIRKQQQRSQGVNPLGIENPLGNQR